MEEILTIRKNEKGSKSTPNWDDQHEHLICAIGERI